MTQLTIIFDIDGVIVDSEQLHFDALLKAVPEQAKNFNAEQLIGLSLEATLDTLGIPKHRHLDLTAQLTDIYNSMLHTKYLRSGIQDFITSLEKKQIPFGFVSTAPRDVCLSNLGLLDLRGEIHLISGTDIARTKPYPDPYLEMLNILEADPKQTIVIEDTDLGITAAHQAEIKYIYGWPHALSKQQNYLQATEVIHSLDQINLINLLESF